MKAKGNDWNIKYVCDLPWMAGRSIAMLVSPQPWIIPIISLSSRLDF